jgi:anti-sigma B factor antagonist
MALIISTRHVGSALVLELKGRVTLGEGSVMLRGFVEHVVTIDKPQRVILDISGVRYIDSSGVGELVSAFTTIKNALNCDLQLCHPLRKVSDLLQITKLYTVFRPSTTVEEALSGVAIEEERFRCLVDSCQTWTLVQPGRTYQSCARCQSRYRFGGPGDIRMSVYPGEEVVFTRGGIPTIAASGTVDLFTTNILQRAWKCMDWWDRRAIFDLASAMEITERALLRLLKIVKDTKLVGQSPILLPERHPLASTPETAVYTDREKAQAAFREGQPG